MGNVSSTMLITKESLIKINKEIMNKKKFDKTLIEIVGDPKVTDSVISEFNSNTAVFHNGLFFKDTDAIKIDFQGLLGNITDGGERCAWVLENPAETESDIRLNIGMSSLTLIVPGSDSLHVAFEPLDKDEVFNVSATITSKECSISIKVRGKEYTVTVAPERELVISSYTRILLGNEKAGSTDFWLGSIYPAEFQIWKNDKEYYSPSKDNSFHFTKILVGDGVFPLKNNSEPVLGHVYELPVMEVTRNNTNVLLTAHIGEDVYLNIQEIGLYTSGADGTHLFTLISGLAIKKGADLEYDLIINVKLDINVVNTVAVPQIRVVKKEYAKYGDFKAIDDMYTFLHMNMERIIRMNAFGIGKYIESAIQNKKPVGVGYNNVQSIHRYQQELELLRNSCVATNAYAKAKKHFSVREDKSFDISKVNAVGSVLVDEKGEANIFSNVSYVTARNFIPRPYEWEAETAFRTSLDTTSNQTVLCLANEAKYTPLVVGIKDNRLHVALSSLEKMSVYTDEIQGVYERTGSDTIINNTKYYIWINQASSEWILTETPTATTNTDLYDANGTLLSSKPTDVFTWEIVNESVFNIEGATEYRIKVGYKNELYYVACALGKGGFTRVFEKANNAPIGNINQCYLGITCDTDNTMKNPFRGTLLLQGFRVSSRSNGKEKCTEESFLKSSKVGKDLVDFFSIPDYPFSLYKVANLCKEESKLEVFEETFKVYDDSIVFSTGKGVSFSVKVHLEDMEDKIILAKCNPSNGSTYFVLKLEDEQIKFRVYGVEETVSITKLIKRENVSKYIEQPILVTITYAGYDFNPMFKMYLNTDLVGEFKASSDSFPMLEHYNITNYLTNESKKDVRIKPTWIGCVADELSPNEIFLLDIISTSL